MLHKTRQEAYQAFLDFVRKDSQQERSAVNRRMLSVLLWCFVIPALLSGGILVLVRSGIVPLRARGYVEFLFLLFPISYSLFFLASEVLKDLPNVFRQGGLSASLRQFENEGAWRGRVVEALRRAVQPSREEWNWIVSSFRADLEILRYRTKYITALSGAVFFIIIQGIDFLSEDPEHVTLVKDPRLGWIELAPSETAQWAGLLLFLVLLFLSGSQNTQSLGRYLSAAELGLQESEEPQHS